MSHQLAGLPWEELNRRLTPIRRRLSVEAATDERYHANSNYRGTRIEPEA